MSIRPVPFVGIPSCVRKINERTFHTAAERYSDAVVDATGCMPVLIPAIGPKTDCGALLDRLDGLLLTGSPSQCRAAPLRRAAEQGGDACTTPTATRRPCR